MYSPIARCGSVKQKYSRNSDSLNCVMRVGNCAGAPLMQKLNKEKRDVAVSRVIASKASRETGKVSPLFSPASTSEMSLSLRSLRTMPLIVGGTSSPFVELQTVSTTSASSVWKINENRQSEVTVNAKSSVPVLYGIPNSVGIAEPTLTVNFLPSSLKEPVKCVQISVLKGGMSKPSKRKTQ